MDTSRDWGNRQIRSDLGMGGVTGTRDLQRERGVGMLIMMKKLSVYFLDCRTF